LSKEKKKIPPKKKKKTPQAKKKKIFFFFFFRQGKGHQRLEAATGSARIRVFTAMGASGRCSARRINADLPVRASKSAIPTGIPPRFRRYRKQTGLPSGPDRHTLILGHEFFRLGRRLFSWRKAGVLGENRAVNRPAVEPIPHTIFSPGRKSSVTRPDSHGLRCHDTLSGSTKHKKYSKFCFNAIGRWRGKCPWAVLNFLN
jgi:hypothetical protein